MEQTLTEGRLRRQSTSKYALLAEKLRGRKIIDKETEKEIDKTSFIWANLNDMQLFDFILAGLDKKYKVVDKVGWSNGRLLNLQDV